MVTSAVDELRLLLHDKLLLERDDGEVHEELEEFLAYVEGHPMQFTVLEVVPLDWSLPVTILDLCITYQIIVVQITNLF
ncbi:uncharacterized protein LOC135081838 [Ostrinia nubilalis]|uniref:uncharacterized protein LOC135081838 n=1 Tax=Ostrinia nubilalis TaxID=29057 RepID=UPI0030825F57